MPAGDFNIRGGRVVLPDEVVEADIAVRDGRIAEIGSLPGGGVPEVDARGLHVMAGRVETHVHFRDPGSPQCEDFATGTAAAAIGGATFVMDMPNSMPPVSTAASFEAKRAAVAPKAHVDFGLYGGAGAGNIETIVEQAEAGVIAFKSFMNPPAPTAEPGAITRCHPDDGSFHAAMVEIGKTGLVGVIHAENDSVCTRLAAEFAAAGRRKAIDHAHSRPPFTEEEAVQRAIILGGAAGARISFAHISTAGAARRIRDAKDRGQSVTAECCPHHMLLTEEALERAGPFGRINPPLRPEADRAAVFEALLAGTIDFVGTDHSPYTVAQKERGIDDIWRAPSGAHGVETATPMLLTAAFEGKITLPALSRAMSLNAARIFGLYPRKGVLAAGADADIILVDTGRRARVERGRLQSPSRDAARLWDGRETRGAVVATYVRGREVAREGHITGEPGWGTLVKGRGR